MSIRACTQLVEYDGWDRLDREINSRFTVMTPEVMP